MESHGTFGLIDMVYYYFPFTRRRRGLEEGLGGLDVESLVGMRKWDLKQRRDMSRFLQAHSTNATLSMSRQHRDPTVCYVSIGPSDLGALAPSSEAKSVEGPHQRLVALPCCSHIQAVNSRCHV